MSQFYSSNRYILLLNQFWQGWIKVTFIVIVNGTQFLCFSLPCVWHTDPVHPCVHVQTALPVDDCAQVPPFKQGFGLQGLLVATIPGMLNDHHENEKWLKNQEMSECLKTYLMICCIVGCYIHNRRGTVSMKYQLCMAADHCSSRFSNRIVFNYL